MLPIAFGVLPLRGVPYSLTSNTVLLVVIQVLDGVVAAIFGDVSVLVIANLTRGTGRFNLTLGAITTAVGNGVALRQVIAGSIVHEVGSSADFLFLAGVASETFASAPAPRERGLADDVWAAAMLVLGLVSPRNPVSACPGCGDDIEIR